MDPTINELSTKLTEDTRQPNLVTEQLNYSSDTTLTAEHVAIIALPHSKLIDRKLRLIAV